MSPSDFPVDQSQRDAAENLRRMSDSETEPEPPRRVLRARRDVNYLDENDDPDEFERISSGESDSSGVEDDDDVALEDEEEDVISDGDAEEMDETFLGEAVQVDKLFYGAVSGGTVEQREAALREMQWKPASSVFEVERRIRRPDGSSSTSSGRATEPRTFTAANLSLLFPEVVVGHDQHRDQPVRTPAGQQTCPRDTREAEGRLARDGKADSTAPQGQEVI